MLPQSQPRKPRNSSKVNLFISFAFHGLILAALFYFAAREGLLGKQLRKIAVEMVKEKPPEKPKEPQKPKDELPKPETPKTVETVKTEAPRTVAQAPPPSTADAPPSAAPPPVDVPSFTFEGGKAVETTSDPVQIYRSLLEYSFRSRWERPEDTADPSLVDEVEVAVDRSGQISNPVWMKTSGNKGWDDSVRRAVAATKAVNRPPPTNFPSRVLVRFDIVASEPVVP